MRVVCNGCGKAKTTAPSDLRKNGTTSETYMCQDCNKRRVRVYPKQDRSMQRKLKALWNNPRNRFNKVVEDKI